MTCKLKFLGLKYKKNIIISIGLKMALVDIWGVLRFIIEEVLMNFRETEIASIVIKYREQHGALLSILEAVQRTNEHNYLPKNELIIVAKELGIPLSQIYSVVTFYAFFNLKPQGDHVITVCRGTACHTRGSKPLLEKVLAMLKIELDEDGMATTSDYRFTVHTVSCFGQCALAPVVSIDGVIYSMVTHEKLVTLIKTLSEKKKEVV